MSALCPHKRPGRTIRTELAILLLVCTIAVKSDAMIPHFTTEPVPAVISQNSNITLSCAVFPASAEIRWMVDNRLLQESDPYGFRAVEGELWIPSIPDEYRELMFQCVADTPWGTILSRRANISLAVLHKFEERKDLHLNVSVGSNVMLPCQPPESRPPATIMFRYNQSKIINSDTDRFKILPSGNLQILRVTTSDQGQYQCMAENKMRGRVRAAKHTIHLHVVNTEVPNKEPAVIMPRTEFQATVRDNVILECSAIGNPQPVITWEKYGGILLPGRYRQIYGNLYLDNVTVEDEGTYMCKANNGLNALQPDGLKVLMLNVSEPPSIVVKEREVNVSLGGRIKLVCAVSGRPEPIVTWYHNGNFLRDFAGRNRLYIAHAEARHKGLYQCFAENRVGLTHAELLVNVDITQRDTASVSDSYQNVTKTLDNLIEANQTSAGQKSKPKNRRHKKRKHRRKKTKRRKGENTRNLEPPVKLVPPSIPEVKQLSDQSVMLNWTVPENKGPEIAFFRVQYKRLLSKSKDSKLKDNDNRWKTPDIEIDSHVRQFEVSGLKSRGTYKFRIAAVYSNNDNAHSGNSERFEMKMGQPPQSKPPTNKPTIVELTPLEFEGKYGLNVMWQYHVSEDALASSPIEGFYIYYKPYHSSEPFQNVTLLEPSVRAHLLQDVLPGTEYLIKMQSFNAAGNSSYSNQAVMKTEGESSENPDIIISPPPTYPPDDEDNDDGESNENESRQTRQPSSEMLYMILGIVLGVMMLLVIVFMFMCWWKQRQQRKQQRRMMDAIQNDPRAKYTDAAQRLYSDSLRKKVVNGGIAGMNGINGTVVNGHVPGNYHKMNINVNPMSELDTLHSSDGSSHYPPVTFHPNGTLPSHHRTSDNNCNNINQSKSLQNSLQKINHQSSSVPCTGYCETMGGGESMANPPNSLCHNVPIRNNSGEAHDGRSLSSARSCDHNRSCDQRSCDRSCDTGDSSYDDTGGVHSSRHRKRRRRAQSREQATKDQATNTDLSSNDGTMDLAEYNKAISSSQESGQMVERQSPPLRTDFDAHVPCSNAV